MAAASPQHQALNGCVLPVALDHPHAHHNPDKGRAAADQIRAATPGAEVDVQILDLGSLDSIRRASETLRDRHERIDLLINNAGVMYTPLSRTADGFEMQFGTNHLGTSR